MSSGGLENGLSKTTSILGMKLWPVIGTCVGVFIVFVLCSLYLWLAYRRKSKKTLNYYTFSQIPYVAKDIGADRLGGQNHYDHPESFSVTVNDKSSNKNSEKMLVQLGAIKSGETEGSSVDAGCFLRYSDASFFINDRYEFPLELDLDREDRKYLSPDADRSVRNLYTLHRSCWKSRLHCSTPNFCYRVLSEYLVKFYQWPIVYWNWCTSG